MHSHSHGDHPRACGAHIEKEKIIMSNLGSSPRMRGSLSDRLSRAEHRGIIPAHAGLTASMTGPSRRAWDHPRACGAHARFFWGNTFAVGSSPRMRGSQILFLENQVLSGIIPAHAGLTSLTHRPTSAAGDHPRACGAHLSPLIQMWPARGSSPRMRGSPTTLSSGIWLPWDHPRACGAHVGSYLG